MASESTMDKLGFGKLKQNNMKSWSGDMKAELMKKKCMAVVRSDTTPADPLELADWTLTKEQASGIVWSGLDDANKELVRDLLGEPKQMWDTLMAHHSQQRPATRFITYEALLGITLKEDELLTNLCSVLDSIQPIAPMSLIP